MSQIFLNYRREDTAAYAGRLYDRIVGHFGHEQVFIDIDQIDPGEDFLEIIQQKIALVRVAVVLIGKQWLSITDSGGQRRLQDPNDFVRLEIAGLLERNVRIIPVLVGGAVMPTISQLPEGLSRLARRNAIEISDSRFHQDVDKLISTLEKTVKAAPNALPQVLEAERGDKKSTLAYLTSCTSLAARVLGRRGLVFVSVILIFLIGSLLFERIQSDELVAATIKKIQPADFSQQLDGGREHQSGEKPIKDVEEPTIKKSPGWVGVEFQDLTTELAESFKHPNTDGALIAAVSEGGPGDKAGLRPGDIIIKVEGKRVTDAHHLLNLIAELDPGKTVTFLVRVVSEKSIEKPIPIEIGARPQQVKQETDSAH